MSVVDEYKYKTPVKRALVVFSGQTELTCLRLLKAGFRHCFVLIECDVEGEGGIAPKWVLYNPLSNATQISLWSVSEDDVLKKNLEQQGYRAVQTFVRPLSRDALPLRPFTCVEAVKRSLGLQQKGLFTPWKLYKFLVKEKSTKKVLDIWQGVGY